MSIFNSPLLETIVCLGLVYALLSLLVGTLTEIVNAYFNERGQQLYNVISRMFSDGANVNFGQMLYDHPMLTNLRKDINSLPQYISNPMFSQALIDTIANHGREYGYDAERNAIVLKTDPTKPETVDTFLLFSAGVEKLRHTALKLLLVNMIEKSMVAGDGRSEKILASLDQQIQQWFGDQMDRTSGWFKDLMRNRVLFISIVVTVILNVNSIYLFKTLYTSPTLRSQLTPIAERLAENYATTKLDTTITALQQAYKAVALSHLQKGNADSAFGVLNKAVTTLDSLQRRRDTVDVNGLQQISDQLGEVAALHIPIGWHSGVPPMNFDAAVVGKRTSWLAGLFWYLIGLAITAFSISAGAPFWFDMLLKLVNIRRAGKKPESEAN